MEHDRLEFPAAVEQLAHNAGLEVPREDGGRDQQRRARSEPIYAALDDCNRWYQQQLRRHSQARRAVDYLKGRGLTGHIARQFGIGYAPPGWDNLIKALARTEAQKALLNEAGMLVARDDKGYYDRFRDRIMFPIHDIRGRIIAFGGRVLGDDTPKYLNSPETPVFSKSRELYGLYEARRANRELARLVIVEGYMDVVALAQHGIDYAAATLGTAVGKAHLERIFRHTPWVIFCFDGDKAGRSAARRALEATMPLMSDGRQASFLFLDEGEDPDSTVRKIGKQAFERQFEASQPIADFLFESFSAGIDLGRTDGRSRFSNLCLPLIRQAPEGVFKELLTQELARLTGLDRETMAGIASRQEPVAREPGPAPAVAPTPLPPAPGAQPAIPGPVLRQAQRQLVEKTPLRAALATLLLYPGLASLAPEPDELRGLDSIEAQLLVEMLDLLRREPDTRTHTLVGSWLNTDKHDLATALLGFEDLLEDEDKAREEFAGALKRIRRDMERRALEQEWLELSRCGSMSAEQKMRYKEVLAALQANNSRHT
jgi:DNA primase